MNPEYSPLYTRQELTALLWELEQSPGEFTTYNWESKTERARKGLAKKLSELSSPSGNGWKQEQKLKDMVPDIEIGF